MTLLNTPWTNANSPLLGWIVVGILAAAGITALFAAPKPPIALFIWNGFGIVFAGLGALDVMEVFELGPATLFTSFASVAAIGTCTVIAGQITPRPMSLTLQCAYFGSAAVASTILCYQIGSMFNADSWLSFGDSVLWLAAAAFAAMPCVVVSSGLNARAKRRKLEAAVQQLLPRVPAAPTR